MAESSTHGDESNVCVAVKIRPLVPIELDDGCQECLFVTPGLPQVSTGQHTFTYDHVFGNGGSPPDLLYSKCIAPLVDGLFKGYNATVFAYGQTGSGKTFTMGSEYKPGGRSRGVIPDAINDIFSRIEAAKDRAITVRVSFVEIHKEEVKDLLLPASSAARPAVTIRETQSGDVSLYGAVEKEVRSREEMAEVLELGALCRSTASTSMNNRSSRSHAIFTITIEQRRQVQQLAGVGTQGEGAEDDGDDEEEAGGDEGEGIDDFLGAKMHLVDLAGSERAKRTKAEGARLREGIHINRGLLALGNVINAIVDNHKHVPYRDSKLTRLLQDSLGGNSRTVMIACVSPADSNHEESLNTLRYADRARHIRNKPVVNRDPVAAQLAVLRATIAQLKSENLSLRRTLTSAGHGDTLPTFGGVADGLVERLHQENSMLEQENIRLKIEMDELRRNMDFVTEKWHTAQAQCDLLRMNHAAAAARRESSQNGSGVDVPEDGGEMPMPGLDIIKGYVTRIAALEAEVKSLKSFAHIPFLKRREARTPGKSASTPDGPADPSAMAGNTTGDGDGDEDPGADSDADETAEAEYYMEWAARQMDQENMHKEVLKLQRTLEAKEQKMQQLLKDAVSVPVAKQQYDRTLLELQAERDRLVSERKALMEKLAAIASAGEEERKRLEGTFRERLQKCDEQIKELRRKEREFINLARLQQRTEEAKQRLSADIAQIKQQKVALQRQLEASAKQNAAWRQEKEKEISQLRRKGRKDQVRIQQLEAVTAKQNAVLQRKISEAYAARKRLKEMSEINKRRSAGPAAAAVQQQMVVAAAQQSALGNVETQPNAQAPVLRTEKERREWLTRELELCDASSQFRKVIEGEIAERAEASRKLKELENRLTLLDQLQPASPLLMAGVAGSLVTVSPGTSAAADAVGAKGPNSPDGRQALLARKKELEDKVAYHNAQISELQADWERHRLEEEQRGVAALDARRWAGLRNVVECRELLRTLFKISLEAKTHCDEYFFDLGRLQEETALLRVQLEGAVKKSAQYRKLAMAYQAAAACAMAARGTQEPTPANEVDMQVEAVLTAHKLRKTPGTRSGKVLPSSVNGSQSVPSPEMAVACPSVRMEDNCDVDMMDVDAPSEAAVTEVKKALDFLSPVPSMTHMKMRPTEAAAQRYSPEHEANSDDERETQSTLPPRLSAEVSLGKAMPTSSLSLGRGKELEEQEDDDDDTDSVSTDNFGEVETDDEDQEVELEDDTSTDDAEDEGDGEDDGEDGDDDRDYNWVPEAATPYTKGGRNARRTSGSSRRASRQASLDDEMVDLVSELESLGKGRTKGRTTAKKAAPSRRISTSADVELERHVLNAINLNRDVNGQSRVLKLTVAVLKEALKGKVIDGKQWQASTKARAKTRPELIADYRRLLGTDGGAAPESHEGQPEVTPGTSNGLGNGPYPIGTDVRALGVGGDRLPLPAPLSPPESSDAEGFTFSPHVAQPASEFAAGTTVAAPVSTVPQLMGSLTPSGSSRRNLAPQVQPWARSSQATAPVRPSNWEQSLRSAAAPPSADAGSADHGSSIPQLARSNSGVSSGSSQRGLGAGTGSGAVGIGGTLTSRRPLGWGTSTNGAGTSGALTSRDAGGSRCALASPRQSISPRLSGQTSQTATGATSPRTSLGSPTLCIPPRYTTKSPGATTSSPGEPWSSRERGYVGGENRQPECSTPTGTTPSVKGSPMSTHWKEKAQQARMRSDALRQSMQANWEKHDPQQHARASGAAGFGRASVTSLGTAAGASGTIASNNEGALRVSGGLRDSISSRQGKAIWR